MFIRNDKHDKENHNKGKGKWQESMSIVLENERY